MAGVHAIPAGTPFLDALARGVRRRVGDDPLALARATILLPTRRAARALAAAFLRAGGGAASVAPRTLTLGDLDDDDVWTDSDGAEREGVPPAIAPLERQVRLAELLRAKPALAPDAAAALRLAGSLAELLDAAALEDADLGELGAVVPAELAIHWQASLDALDLVRARWPAMLAAEGLIDPAARRVRLIRARAERWRRTPPAGLVVAAGSTGSIPATAELLGVVAGLSDGHVVLPGLDRDLDEASWTAAGDDPCHPQHGLAHLLASLGVARAAVSEWIGDCDPSPRARLVAEALRPAPTTDAWIAAGAPPSVAFSGLQRIEASEPGEEAAAIALVLRETLEHPGRSAALVTPDRELARRVASELQRWSLAVDDSAGVPLGASPPGAFLRLAAAAADRGARAVELLAALKHDLARAGLAPGDLRARVRRIDRVALRGLVPAPGLAGAREAVERASAARGRPEPALLDLVDRLAAAAAPFADALDAPKVAPVELLRRHVAFAEFLAADPEAGQAGALWRGEAGEQAAAFVVEADAALAAMEPIPGRDWPALFDSLLAGSVVRPRAPRHSRLAIWGPLEARLQAVDLLVLGGLNEGTWPGSIGDDPWLSRGMREKLGLPPAERRIGLSAHDFAMAAANPRVVLTRSRKVGGAPTRPARWLQRLEAMVGADAGWRATASGRWTAWRRALEQSAEPSPARPPRPCPPVILRPRKLSVTQVETWVRDPYALYARHVLGLRALDPLDADPDASERGTIVHDALERFVRATREAWPADPLDALLACGEAAFAPFAGRPAVRALWWPRFVRAAGWFVAWETARREAGYRPLAIEAEGCVSIPAPGGDFTLIARADRIDAGPGGPSIIDYKTGAPPSAKQVRTGFSPQLPLEAAIAAAGRFAGVAAGPAAELLYLRLGGGEPPGVERRIAPSRDDDVVALATEAFDGLQRRIALFDHPATPYESRLRPVTTTASGDYDHLARVAEWSIAGAVEDDG